MMMFEADTKINDFNNVLIVDDDYMMIMKIWLMKCWVERVMLGY